jgi:hypothetical protein
LTSEESNAWLAARGRDERVITDTTIAELYARLEGLDPGETRLIGFGDSG